VKYLPVFRAIEWELHQEQYRFGILAAAPSWTIRDINTNRSAVALLVIKRNSQLNIDFS
jgi:hypothetical protein